MSKTYQCQVCGKTKNKNEIVPAAVIRPVLSSLIKQKHPDFSESGYICLDDLNLYRNNYIQNLLEDEKGELTQLENTVIQSLKDHEILSRNIDIEYEGAKVMVTYHSAALLRNPHWKKDCWEDLKKFRKLYEEIAG